MKGRLSGAISGASPRLSVVGAYVLCKVVIRRLLYIGLPYPSTPTHATLASMNDSGQTKDYNGFLFTTADPPAPVKTADPNT